MHARLTWALVPFLASLGAISIPAQSLLREINAEFNRRGDSNPHGFTRSGSSMFFVAESPLGGDELWVTDGTTVNTHQVSDLAPGTDSSFPFEITDLDGAGRVVFVADAGSGRAVWVSDGSAAGTFELHAAGFFVGALTRVGSEVLYFTDRALWKTDGTVGGTVQVRALTPGFTPYAAGDDRPAVLLGDLLFAGSDGAGVELWKSDGTAAGTFRVHDINPTGSSQPRGFTVIGNRAVFRADDGATGEELWVTDGTGGGTALVADLWAGGGSGPHEFHAHGNVVYFTAFVGYQTAFELWKTDGTTAGTVLVKDIAPGPEDGRPGGFVSFGNLVLFRASHPATGAELWRTDGTASGTLPVADLWAGGIGSFPRALTSAGSYVIFNTQGGLIWRTDGTAAGTVRVTTDRLVDRTATPAFAELNGAILFPSATGQDGVELWQTRGTAATTSQVAEIYERPSPSQPWGFERLGDALLFAADDGGLTNHGRELWKTDGTLAGTTLVADLDPGTGSGDPVDLTRVGDVVFFGATTPATGEELWVTDGSAAGTRLVREVIPGPSGSDIRELTAFKGEAYFTAYDGAWRGLWHSDGTAGGTGIVLVGPYLSPEKLTVVDDRLFFFAYGLSGPGELWVSDGTASGTQLVADTAALSQRTVPHAATAWNGAFYCATGPAGSKRLWRSDGTPAGTTSVVDVVSTITDIVPFAGALLFTTGTELWRSDGTPAGTARILDLGGYGVDLVVAGDRVFVVGDSAGGARNTLWISDGTAANTIVVRSPSDRILRLDPVGRGRQVLYSVWTIDGMELWTSDGTMAGTRRLPSAAPQTDFVSIGRTVVFGGYDEIHGIELWNLDAAQIDASIAETYGRGCAGSGGLVPRLDAIGAPRLGERGFALVLDDARAQSAAAFAIAPQPLAFTFPGGCTIYTGGPTILASRSTDAAGRARLDVAVPSDPSLLGSDHFTQAYVADPQGALAGLVAVSAGLRLLIGR